MRTSILLSLFLVACGGSQFQGSEVTQSDAGSDSNLSVDAQSTLDGSGTVDTVRLPEASTDSFEADATSDSDGDSWPDDVVLEPYCLTSEVYPAYSPTCQDWASKHGWTVTPCCLPDHNCGHVMNNRCIP